MNEIGERYRVRLFGSSHGPEVGAEVDGVPKGTAIDTAAIQGYLDRRRPVGRRLATHRAEEDRLVVDSGISEGRADGTIIRAHVANEDVRREPYDRVRNIPRPGHADYPARVRYGADADLSGGGIFSGRMTVGLVIAGAIAAQLLGPRGIEAVAFPVRIGRVNARVPEGSAFSELRRASGESEVGCPDTTASLQMEEEIVRARREGDSVGGVIEARLTGLPVGVGEPFFNSLESVLAHWLFSIPAVKGVEFGDGFQSAGMRGSEHNDPYILKDGAIALPSNHSGGILGGLSTGAPLILRVAVKPTSSIAKPQRSVDLESRTPVELVVTGRHDPCIVPRASVVVESVALSAVLDLLYCGGFA
ncbi:MAG: chorismate synthase [Thermoplasmata archaeon]|nr:chorismate synthase [Thermoplasmata archaeon]